VTLIRTEVFAEWLNGLDDRRGKARILARLTSAEHGNFGDCEPVGDGVLEMRVHFGSGYQVYFTRFGNVVYVLLCGGDKASQRRDIGRAKAMARELRKSNQ